MIVDRLLGSEFWLESEVGQAGEVIRSLIHIDNFTDNCGRENRPLELAVGV